ncbi:MAG: ATP-grasp domain-containing protein [Myxococcales bacterium]|nr:ATP-grasp domain-containing protein [Myxococcales bacterium]
MSRVVRVLVFPSCNEPGLEIIESLLQHPRFQVVGASSLDPAVDPSAAMLERHFTLPSLYDAHFHDALDALLVSEEIDLIFSSMDVVTEAFSLRRFPRGVFVGPAPEIAAICASKRSMLRELAGVVPLPADLSGVVSLPAFAKPDRGGGSRGTRVVNTVAERDAALKENCVLQQVLPGDEYTVDCCGDRDGNLLTATIRRRAAIGRGIALATEIVEDDAMMQHVQALADRLRIAGPFFVQFKRDAGGVARLLEVNARVGGSMTGTRLHGINIPLMAALSFLGVPVQAPRPVQSPRMVRRLTQTGQLAPFTHVIWDLDDTLVHADGNADPMAVAHVLDLHQRGVQQLVLTLNQAPKALMATAFVPDCFVEVHTTTHKVDFLRAWFVQRGVSPGETVLINDSGSERRALESEFADLRCLAPWNLETLGWRRR